MKSVVVRRERQKVPPDSSGDASAIPIVDHAGIARGVFVKGFFGEFYMPVYVIQRLSGGPYKIGVSVQPEKRLSSLQIGIDEPIRIVLLLPGDRGLESKIHAELAAHKIRGEWFSDSDQVTGYLWSLLKADYEVVCGVPRAVLYRKTERSLTDACPFCGTPHLHGLGDGHRVAHCSVGRSSAIAKDGTVLSRDDGYIIKTIHLPDPELCQPLREAVENSG